LGLSESAGRATTTDDGAASAGAVIRNEWSGEEVASSNASNSQPQNRPQLPDAPLTTCSMMKEKAMKDWTVAEWVAFMKGKTALR
jgi:hypothetical protein